MKLSLGDGWRRECDVVDFWEIPSVTTPPHEEDYTFAPAKIAAFRILACCFPESLAYKNAALRFSAASEVGDG